LPKRGYRLRVLLRRPSVVPMDAASAVVGDLARPQNMAAALADVDAVIHSAGLAHAMSGLPEDDYRMLNTEATIGLARAAQRAGAKRFVFPVLDPRAVGRDRGPESDRGSRRRNRRTPMAARSLRRSRGSRRSTWTGSRCGSSWCTAAGVKGNMAELVRFARSPYPLPLGLLRARRSLLSLDNLVAAIDAVLTTPERLRRPLIVADPKALTIPEDDRGVYAAGSAAARPHPDDRFPCSKPRCGRRDGARLYQRLAGSLVADPSRASRLGWTPAWQRRGSQRSRALSRHVGVAGHSDSKQSCPASGRA
jgi:UDP-glucose 4-epimerase